jgi:hypothetical protein
MKDIFRFILLPGGLILFATWWLALKHRRSALMPFLVFTTALLLLLRLLGFSPLGFFVSIGGWGLFALLAWASAGLTRGFRHYV